jgi:hypothetical protein
VDDFGQPMIPSTVPGRCSFLDLDNPAVTTSQTRHSMHAMSLKARLGVKTTPEDLRRNSVADLSHQSSYLINLLRGNASAKLEPSVRHTMASFTKNVTEMYGGGGMSRLGVYQQRALGFALVLKNRKYTFYSEVKDSCRAIRFLSRSLDLPDRLAKRRATVYVRKAWRQVMKNEEARSVSAPQKPSKYHQARDKPSGTSLTARSDTHQILGTTSSSKADSIILSTSERTA